MIGGGWGLGTGAVWGLMCRGWNMPGGSILGPVVLWGPLWKRCGETCGGPILRWAIGAGPRNVGRACWRNCICCILSICCTGCAGDVCCCDSCWPSPMRVFNILLAKLNMFHLTVYAGELCATVVLPWVLACYGPLPTENQPGEANPLLWHNPIDTTRSLLSIPHPIPSPLYLDHYSRLVHPHTTTPVFNQSVTIRFLRSIYNI